MLKHSLEQYLSANTDRFNCRWLCNRDPDLWGKIIEATDFLPDNSLPKQRCWHVLNDIWECPLCPVDGVPVKWYENRYLTYSSVSAQKRCPEHQARSRATYEARTGYDGHWSSDPAVRARIREKRIANPQRGYKRSPEWHAKIKATWDKKLQVLRTPEGMRSFKRYRRQVDQISRRHHKHSPHLIENGHLPRSKEGYHLDHVFSVFDGWRLGVSPEIVAHPSNLRMITRSANSKKQHRSDKSLDQLYCHVLEKMV